MIAGFEIPTSGTILLGGRDVTKVPPFDRDVNTVFQDYALFPHMTVAANVEYGMRVAGRRQAASAAAAPRRRSPACGSPGYGDRKPSEMSGGQRQRVALARALVNRPRVLLLDEPLGALDLKLREEMQVELKAIQREVGITFVFVTHDQEEALTMSDRIAVFNAGRIEQVGSPSEVYERPANRVRRRIRRHVEPAAPTRRPAPCWARTAPGRCGRRRSGSPARTTRSAAASILRSAPSARSSMPARPPGTWSTSTPVARLTVQSQNLRTSSMDVLALRGTRTRLVWERAHEFQVV